MAFGVDVLNLEWTSFLSRDRQMASLVCNYLRFQGYSVVEDTIFNGYELIKKYKPKVLFMTNAIGSTINYEICKYAGENGISVVTLISEGNFRENEIVGFLWGWNPDQKLYETYNLQWTVRTKEMTLKYYPSLNNQIKVSGGVGFDVYKIQKSISKEDLLKNYGKDKFTRVIGIGCWDFGPFYPEDPRYKEITQNLTPDEVAYMRLDGKKFNEILEEIIPYNQDILFLLKEHPGCIIGKKGSAIENLEQYSNVLILKHEESIFNCMTISDFWITYESTTAMEAWLMDKKTCLLNPQGGDFKRDSIYLGSPIISTTGGLQNTIDLFYETEQIAGFEERKEIRKKLIEETIQCDDGLNHVRAGNVIIELVNNFSQHGKQKNLPINKNVIISYVGWHFSSILRHIGLFKGYYLHRKSFSYDELKLNQNILNDSQLSFYSKNGLSQMQLKKYKCF